MKRFLMLFLLLSSLCLSVSAQSLDRAESEYSTFLRLRQAGGDQSVMYQTLFNAYQDYISILRNSQRGSQGYVSARQRLYELRPYLQQGAVWYSQKGSQQNALLLAQAFVDIPLMEDFAGMSFPKDDYYSTMVYFAASGTYNSKDYARAIPYLSEYLKTGDARNRKNVYMFLAKACSNIGNYGQAVAVLEEAVAAWPSDFNILSMAVNACIDAEDDRSLQRYVSKALGFKPNDPTLLNIQGKLYERVRNYSGAVAVYEKLQSLMPRSLDVAEHLATNTYNLAALYYNQGDRAGASEYFRRAIPVLESVVATNPGSVKFLQALATAYNCTGNREFFQQTNRKLLAAGGMEVSGNDIPSLMGYNETPEQFGGISVQRTGSYTDPYAFYASSSASSVPAQPSSPAGAQYAQTGTPLYSAYARKYVEDRIGKWQEKDPYETVDEYKARVTEQTRQAKVQELMKAAEDNYISIYAEDLMPSEVTLRPYDAENEVFLAETPYGEIIIPVPRADNEARMFESNWNGMQLRNPKYYIKDDRLALSSLTFVSPTGQIYKYDDENALNYTQTVVDMQFSEIDYSHLASNTSSHGGSSPRIKQQNVSVGASDVDINIPENPANNEKTFAVIIANENYQMVSSVPMALNDGRTLAKYCQQTLGLPESNIRYYEDATYGVFTRALKDIKNISTAYDGDIDVIFYYAGHGVPDEKTKDAYLLPVDSDGKEVSACFPLSRVYADLGSLNAQSVLVLMDACFSGGSRDGDMVLEKEGMRGIVVRPKQDALGGNMIVFSAVSDDQTAMPYKEKGHGLFTYFLLKKLQETKGNVTLSELTSYVAEKVEQRSVVINRKVQTPTVRTAIAVADTWKSMKLRK